jgi:hypothetical protein
MSRDRSVTENGSKGPHWIGANPTLFHLGKETSSFRIRYSVDFFLNHGRRTKIETWIVLVNSFILQKIVHLKKPIVRHLVKNLQNFVKFRCLLPCFRELATCPYRKPDESTPRHPISLRFDLMLSANVRLGIRSSLLASGVPTKILCAFLSPLCTS